MIPASFRADLHTHTNCSDGSLSPKQLIQKSAEIGLQGLSITDHDTVEAYKTAFLEAKRLGIILGTGIECSCLYGDDSVHVLGYGFSFQSPIIESFCKEQQQIRGERNRAILKKLKSYGMDIEEEELAQTGTVGRPHIAKVMIQKGYVDTLQRAFDLYLAEGKKCYQKGSFCTVEKTLEILHAANAKAFIAHPHLFRKRKLVKKLVDLPFDGIECYYGRCPPEGEKRFIELAKEKGFLVSGGSDFHGSIRAHLPLGSSWVDKEHFEIIFGKIL